MIYLVINLLLWLLPIFIPFNYNFFNSFNLTYYIPIYIFWMIYVLGIISLSILIFNLVKKNKFNNDLLFWFCTLWLFNILTFIYFSCFESILWFRIFSGLEILNLMVLYRNVKKINKGFTKYLFLFVLIYLYLIIIFI